MRKIEEASQVERYCELGMPVIQLTNKIIAALCSDGYYVDEEPISPTYTVLKLTKKKSPIAEIQLMVRLKNPADDLELIKLEREKYLSAAGRISGSVKSPKKARASRRNGKLGGRPRKESR